MEVQIKELSSIKREISVVVPAEDVSPEYEKALRSYAARAKVKGFRPGKVPVELVQRMYAAEIRETVIDAIIPKSLSQAMKDQNLEPVGMPVLTDLHYDEGQPLQFKAELEIWPEFELPDYKKIKLKKKDSQVTDEDIDKALEDIQAQSAQYVPSEDREIRDGDYVVAEIKGRDVDTKRYLPTEKAVVLANHPDNEKKLNENLAGLKKDEETQFTITYEKDHHNKKVAGKTIDYNLKVLSIKEKKLPEIDDDFAKDLGDYKDLNELKDKLKDQLIRNKEQESRGQSAEEIIRKIEEKIKIDIPDTVLEQETNSVLQRRLEAARRGQPLSGDMDALKKEAREKAESNIKNHLILAKIAEKENLEVSEDDFSEELNKLAEANRMTLAQVRENISHENREQELRENLLIRKTVDFLLDNAIIK